MELAFLEIGTSDFATLIATSKDTCRGISVEPVREYLDRLPDKPLVRKICAAVSDTSGNTTLYLVPDQVRIDYGLPVWMKGTNSIGAPHPTVVRYLTNHGLPLDLIESRTVPVIALSDLLHDVTSLETLKIDTEGHDTVIMAEMCRLMQAGGVRPAHIRYESNSLADQAQVAAVNQQLEALGYVVRRTATDTYADLPPAPSSI